MKRFLTTILISALLLTFTACNNQTSDISVVTSSSVLKSTESSTNSSINNNESSNNKISKENSENISDIKFSENSNTSHKNESSVQQISESLKENSSTTGNTNTSSSSSSYSENTTVSKPCNISSSSTSSKPSDYTSSENNSSSSISSSKPSHSHSYSSKTVKATCTSGGYTVHTCSCGASYTDSYTDATGHRWSDWKTVKKATTSSEGRKQRTCSSCGKTESKTIAKVKGSSTSGGHKITGARKAVYSYRGMDSFSSVNLVDLINAERAKEGLGKLEWTADGLTRAVREDPDAAEVYEDYFDSNGNFNPYIDPEVREPLEGAQKMANMGYATHGNGVGCSCVGASEGASTIEEALRRQIKAYMNSPEHRAILMNAGSHRVTAAYAIDSNGTVYTAILVGGRI